MSEPVTATEQAIELLAEYPNEAEAKKHIKEIAKKLNTSRATVYRALKKVSWKELETIRELPPAEEVTISIPEEKEREEITPEEVAEVPTELGEVPPEAVSEVPPLPEEIPPEVEKCQPIFERSINRLVNILTNRLAGIPELGLTPEESADTMVLVGIGLTKYTPVVMEKYYFETTALLHVTSIALDKFTIWKLKKREEKPPESVETPTETPIEKPTELPEGIPKEDARPLPHMSRATKERLLQT